MKKLTCLFFVCCVFVSNAVADGLDTRTVILLSPEHRTVILGEMQHFLSGLQQISAALSHDDMETVTRVARSLGSAMSHHVPADLKQVLPQAFRKQGHAVHSHFDQLAMDAESLGDGHHALSQLSEILSGCVSCHSTYQIKTE